MPYMFHSYNSRWQVKGVVQIYVFHMLRMARKLGRSMVRGIMPEKYAAHPGKDLIEQSPLTMEAEIVTRWPM